MVFFRLVDSRAFRAMDGRMMMILEGLNGNGRGCSAHF